MKLSNFKQHTKCATLNIFSSNEAGVQSLHDIFTQTLGFDSVTNQSSSKEMSVTDGYCRINFWSNSAVSSVRNALRKPNITRLSSLILHQSDSGGINVHNEFNKYFPQWKLLFGNNPKLNTELRKSKNDTILHGEDDMKHRPLLKEIVLGLKTSDDYNFYSSDVSSILPLANASYPGLFSISKNKLLTLRLVPSQTSTLVFHVDDINEAEEQLTMINMNGGKIGFTGARNGQLMLKTPLQDGVDIRLCSNHKIESHFCEGERAVYEGVIKGFGDVAHTTQLGCGHILRKEMIGVAISDKI
jgi:hypothetical protein